MSGPGGPALDDKLPLPGDVIASGRVGRDDREYTFLPRRVAPSNNVYAGFAGSVGSPWVVVGLQLCSRPLGAKNWYPMPRPLVRTMREGLEALALDLDFPERLLIHPLAISLRNDLLKRIEAEKNAPPPAPLPEEEGAGPPPAGIQGSGDAPPPAALAP